MIYTSLTKKAMRIAYDAHAGQLDKGGDPYVFHPFYVAERMPDEVSVCVALLHDVVEDTEVTLQDLACDFPAEVIEALGLLTHEDGVPYLDYVAAAAANPIARRVKLADLEHNSDEGRLSACEGLSESDRARLRDKYAQAKALLRSFDCEH